MTSAAIVIPWRDRGRDPRRPANLAAVIDWWKGSPWHVTIAGDGRSGDAQFNRSAAYNRGARDTDAEVLIYTESDMLLPWAQIHEAVQLAAREPGLVVPFTQYRYMSEADSEMIRVDLTPDAYEPESTMDDGRSIGAVNVVSRATLEAVGGGYTERTEGNWFDDDIMRRAFDVCAGPTRWVEGPAYHLYHLPGWKGDHLTDADRAATARNKALRERVKAARTADEIRALL